MGTTSVVGGADHVAFRSVRTQLLLWVLPNQLPFRPYTYCHLPNCRFIFRLALSTKNDVFVTFRAAQIGLGWVIDRILTLSLDGSRPSIFRRFKLKTRSRQCLRLRWSNIFGILKTCRSEIDHVSQSATERRWTRSYSEFRLSDGMAQRPQSHSWNGKRGMNPEMWSSLTRVPLWARVSCWPSMKSWQNNGLLLCLWDLHVCVMINPWKRSLKFMKTAGCGCAKTSWGWTQRQWMEAVRNTEFSGNVLTASGPKSKNQTAILLWSCMYLTIGKSSTSWNKHLGLFLWLGCTVFLVQFIMSSRAPQLGVRYRVQAFSDRSGLFDMPYTGSTVQLGIFLSCGLLWWMAAKHVYCVQFQLGWNPPTGSPIVVKNHRAGLEKGHLMRISLTTPFLPLGTFAQICSTKERDE